MLIVKLKKQKILPSQRVEADVREMIARCSPGDSLGSELGLAESFGVSRMTVRKVVEMLAGEGLIVRKPGVGLFVGGGTSAAVRRFSFIAGNLLWDATLRIARAARVACESAGCGIDLYDAGGSIEKYRELVASLPRTGCAGAIVVSAHDAESVEMLVRLAATSFPLVVIDQDLSSRGVACVTADNLAGGIIAADILISARHRELGFIGDFVADTVQSRWEGFRSACVSKGMNPYKFDLRDGDRLSNWERDVDGLISRILSLSHLPTGIFCSCDAIARYVMRSLASRGIRVPRDVSLVGFDDDPIAEWTTPALTTIRQDFESMGRLAAEKLIGRAVDSSVSPVQVTRILRESVSDISEPKRTKT